MKPVMQTILGPNGNCYAACIASILEEPIELVPNFCLHPDWQVRIKKWLQARGLGIITVSLEHPLFPLSNGESPLPEAFAIMSGPSPRGLNHAVVAINGKMVHDPHPDNSGLVKPMELEFFVALNPWFISHKAGIS